MSTLDRSSLQAPRQTKTDINILIYTCLSVKTSVLGVQVVMDVTMGSFFFKPEKNLEFFRLKNDPIDDYPGRLE